MRYVLENDTLRVEIDSFGAELKSVKRKSDDKEYMWYADKKYWGRTSPVLFPFVGNCRNKEYRYGGKTYAIGTARLCKGYGTYHGIPDRGYHLVFFTFR